MPFLPFLNRIRSHFVVTVSLETLSLLMITASNSNYNNKSRPIV